MNNRIISFVFVMVSFVAKAQNDTMVVNQDFLRVFQMVHSEFSFTGDITDNELWFQKVYCYENQLAKEADSLNLLSDSLIKKQFDLYMQMSKTVFLSNVYASSNFNNNPEITDEEIRSYYERNQSYFSEPGSVSYLISYTSDTTNATEIQDIFTFYKNQNVMGSDQIKKINNGKFILTSEFNLAFSPQIEYYEEMVNAKTYDFIGPIKSYDRWIYIFPLHIEKETLIPFELVKDQCKENLKAEYYSQKEKLRMQNAIKNFPYKFDF